MLLDEISFFSLLDNKYLTLLCLSSTKIGLNLASNLQWGLTETVLLFYPYYSRTQRSLWNVTCAFDKSYKKTVHMTHINSMLIYENIIQITPYKKPSV